MAKNIKAIKCPSCASIKITELKNDYYRCNSCSTEFFLDSDDININHRYYHVPGEKLNIKKLKIWGGLAVISIILFVIIINIFSSKTPNVPKQSTYNATPVVKKEEKQSEYKWTNVSSSVFINDKNIPTTILLGQISKSWR